MTSGGHEVDVGGEGPNHQNNTLDYPFKRSMAVWTPDVSMIVVMCIVQTVEGSGMQVKEIQSYSEHIRMDGCCKSVYSNSAKFETGQNLPPILKIVTCTAHVA